MDTWRSEELINEFCRSLSASGMSPQLAARQRNKLRFFLHAYVAEEWPRHLDRIDGDIIRDFLGGWFIRHVGGSKADITAYLATFRKFFEYLYHTGRISEPEYDDLITACRSRDYFMARYDEHMYSDTGAGSEFPAGKISTHIKAPPWSELGARFDTQIWILAHNLERPHAPALLDFSLFLDYLAGASVKLTRANRLPRPHLCRINQRFTRPEDLPPRTHMESSPRINWFFKLAHNLELARSNEDKALKLTCFGEAFLDLEADAKLAFILDATWNRISWAQMGGRQSRRVSRWAQEHRDGFAALLADLTPGREWALDPEPGVDDQDALLARYILFHEVVENFVLFALRETAVLDYTYYNNGGPRTKVKSITMSRFGRQVMRLLTRRASAHGKALQSPLLQLQESLLL